MYLEVYAPFFSSSSFLCDPADTKRTAPTRGYHPDASAARVSIELQRIPRCNNKCDRVGTSVSSVQRRVHSTSIKSEQVEKNMSYSLPLGNSSDCQSTPFDPRPPCLNVTWVQKNSLVEVGFDGGVMMDSQS